MTIEVALLAASVILRIVHTIIVSYLQSWRLRQLIGSWKNEPPFKASKPSSFEKPH